jgi:HlyD family secretion protein
VKAGDVIATYTPPVLDARQRSSAIQRANAAATLQREAQKRVESLEPLLEQAKRRAGRTKRLQDAGAVSKEQSENAADAYIQLQNEYLAAQSRVKTADYEAQAARIAASAAPGSRVKIYAPISGVVLRRFQDQENTLMAGQPLIEIGDPSTVDVIIDVLSTDAVRISKGLKVIIEGWGGGSKLLGTVRTVEPAARVKISSLGVEEKRVNVVASLETLDDRLGDAYKVDAKIVTWASSNVVRVPLSALFRIGEDWYVFVVRNDQAFKEKVEVGHLASLTAEIKKGLKEGDVVVIHPPEELKHEAYVEERAS